MNIRWYEQKLLVEYTGKGSHVDRPGFGIEAIFGLLRGMPLDAGQHLTFRGSAKSLQKVGGFAAGQRLDIVVTFVLPRASPSDQFLLRLLAHLHQPEHPWRVVEPVAVLQEMEHDLAAPLADPGQEIELDFLTLLPLGPSQLPFGVRALLDMIERRFQQLFGFNLDLAKDEQEQIELLSHLWHREEVLGHSRSQNPGKKRNAPGLNRPRSIGRRGSLFLRGASSRLRRVLEVLEVLHLHCHTNLTGWGNFRIHSPARPFLDRHIGDPSALHAIASATLRLNDGLALMSEGQPTSDADIAATVHSGLKDGHWAVRPTEAALIRKADGGARLIERLHPLDLIAQQHLLKILTHHLDRSLSDAAGAFRPGRSLGNLTARIREALRQGYRYAVRADIEDCFPSIDHQRLFACLDHWLPHADRKLRALLKGFVAAPYELAGTTTLRSRGLAQGSPLSPLLTNLYLDRIDRELVDANFLVLRYADDILILARTRPDAERALGLLTQSVTGIGLQLSQAKTAIHSVAEGFTFLGESFDDTRLEDPVQSLAAQRKPLLLTQPYLSLGANGETLEARSNGKLLDAWPLRRISELIVLGRSTLSTALLEKCARHGIPVSIALNGGYQIATLAPDSRRFHAIAARHGQWHAALSDSLRTAYAARFAATKVSNYLAFMRMRGERVDSIELAKLQKALDAILSTVDVAGIRGHEGAAARVAFQWLQGQIDKSLRPQFAAERRSRGAPDRLNSLLNFGYYLLYTRINSLLRAHGLNPYLGLLHDGQDDYETLVADLQEPFRCHVDRLVLRLINRRQVRTDGFEQALRPRKGEGRYWLARPTLRLYAEEFERMMGEVIGGVILRDALLAQVRALRRCVLGEGAFWLYEWKDRPDRGAPPGTNLPEIVATAEDAIESGDAPEGLLDSPPPVQESGA